MRITHKLNKFFFLINKPLERKNAGLEVYEINLGASSGCAICSVILCKMCNLRFAKFCRAIRCIRKWNLLVYALERKSRYIRLRERMCLFLFVDTQIRRRFSIEQTDERTSEEADSFSSFVTPRGESKSNASVGCTCQSRKWSLAYGIAVRARILRAITWGRSIYIHGDLQRYNLPIIATSRNRRKYRDLYTRT